MIARLFGKDAEEITPTSWEDRQKAYDAALAAEPALDPIIDLPALSDPDGRCPKCGSHALTIQYRSGQHDGCSDWRLRWHPFMWSIDVSPEPMAKATRASERAIEHHDRACVNCKFAWVEAVAE